MQDTNRPREFILTSKVTFDFWFNWLIMHRVSAVTHTHKAQFKTHCMWQHVTTQTHTHENINISFSTLKHTPTQTHTPISSSSSSSSGYDEGGLQTDCWGNGLYSAPLFQFPLLSLLVWILVNILTQTMTSCPDFSSPQSLTRFSISATKISNFLS